MLCYAGYLIFGTPDTIRIFWYVFIVPIGLIVQIFKTRRASGGNTRVSYPQVGGQQPQQAAPAYPQPAGYQPQQAYQPHPGYVEGQQGYPQPRVQQPAAGQAPHQPSSWQAPNQQG